jgi:hypothetical protein
MIVLLKYELMTNKIGFYLKRSERGISCYETKSNKSVYPAKDMKSIYGTRYNNKVPVYASSHKRL